MNLAVNVTPDFIQWAVMKVALEAIVKASADNPFPPIEADIAREALVVVSEWEKAEP